MQQGGFTRKVIGEEDYPGTHRCQKRSLCQAKGRDILRFTVVAQFLDEWNGVGILSELKKMVHNVSDTKGGGKGGAMG